jgi:hypothetical protein
MQGAIMKRGLGAMIVAAALAFAGGAALTPASAAPAKAPADTLTKSQGTEKQPAAGTDISAQRRYHRRYRYARPYYPVYPRYGYYRPRPYYYQPYYPRPYYGYGPGPGFGFGFGPRHYW